MQTIIIVLDPKKMTNPDLDIRYTLPERIEEYTNNEVTDNGYDYIGGDKLGIWLETADAGKRVQAVIELIKAEQFLENDLSEVAQIYVSEQDCAKLEDCIQVYPEQV